MHHSNVLLFLDEDTLNTGKEYDMIILTETWIDKDELQHYKIPGYTSEINMRVDGRKSGEGGCLY